MELLENPFEGISQIEQAQSPLICGLPDDIALI